MFSILAHCESCLDILENEDNKNGCANSTFMLTMLRQHRLRWVGNVRRKNFLRYFVRRAHCW